MKDDHVLQLAVDAKASFVVTGDADLLIHKSIEAINIVRPSEFLKNIR